MEKFQKAYDGLKSGGTLKKKDGVLTSKEKITYCQAITEAIQSQQFKQHADFAKQFSAGFEILFTLCDDTNLDVRTYVDECLNTIIRSNLSDGNATRIHCELYQEIKRNGPARCLRSALPKFAELAAQIRPNRCRTFAKNLLSTFVAVIRRPEEAVQECFGTCVEKMFAVLGRFFSDEETKILIKSVLPNLQLQSAVSRRTAAVFLVELCRNSRKRYTFVAYLFKALLDTLVPIQFDQSVLQLLGTFFALRQLIPILKTCEEEEDSGEELRITQSGPIKLRPHTSLTLEQLIQLYESIMYYSNYAHSSVVTAALETLNQLLISGPRQLIGIILSESDALGRSRIFGAASSVGSLSRSRKGSFSGNRSGVSSLGGSQSDLSSLAIGDLSIDDPVLFPSSDSSSSPQPPSIASTTGDRSMDEDQQPLKSSDQDISERGLGSRMTSPDDEVEDNGDRTYSSIQMGRVIDDPLGATMDTDGGTSVESKRGKLLPREVTPLNLAEGSSEHETMFNDLTSPLSPMFQRDSGFPDEIGSFVETRPPVLYCGRLLCRKFLLNGTPGELIADKDVRVSHKVLALGCLESVCNLYPNVLDAWLNADGESGQRISDVLQFANHDDPQIKGNVAILASTWLKSATVCSGRKIEALPQQVTCEVVRVLSQTLADESGVAARLGVVALTKCYSELLMYDSEACLRLLRQAVGLAKNSYWLLKVAVSDLLAEIDYCTILSAELSTIDSPVNESERFYAAAVDKLINVMLADEDPRVRQSASNGVVCLVHNLCTNTRIPDEIRFAHRSAHFSYAFQFDWHLREFPPIHHLAPGFKFRKNGRSTIGNGNNQILSESSRNNIEENLSYLIDYLIRTLCGAVDKNHKIGCLTALQRLTESYPPTSYESAWCVWSRGKTSSSIELLSLLLSTLKSISFGADSQLVHQILFSLIGSIYAGSSLHDMINSKHQKRPDSAQNPTSTGTMSTNQFPNLASSQLGDVAHELFQYCLRIVSIYWHAVTDQQPAPPPVLTKPPLPQLPQAPSLTPVAQKLKAVATGGGSSGAKSADGKDRDRSDSAQPSPAPPAMSSAKYKASDFYSSIHLMRVFDMVKGAWSNYRISLDPDVEEKFCLLLRSCLDCMNCLLETASIVDVEKYTEELLAYLKPLMPVLPAEVVATVIQLLKALFGTNLPILFHQSTTSASFAAAATVSTTSSTSSVSNRRMQSPNDSTSNVYQTCVLKPRANFYGQLQSACTRHESCGDSLKQHLGWFGSRGERHVMSLLKNATNKATLTSYIRLFEPIVVQGLRLYTSCVSSELQCSVIGLLSQLIQIRVNYSLLDTDRRFLEFLFQQLETIEEGNMRNVESLTKKLFEFFTLLSYEKYQTIPVLEVPKILQLADGLLASSQHGKNTGMLGVMALHPVVLDLYFIRSASKVEAAKELEIQQEVIVSMLIKSIRCGGAALSLLSFVLYQTHKDNESKWKKLSRDIVDAMLPLLAKNQMPLRNADDLGTIFSLTELLCSSAFRPVDPLLSLMLTPPANGIGLDEFCTWFASQIWSLRSLLMYSNEASVTSRLEEMPSAVVGATWLLGQASGGEDEEGQSGTGGDGTGGGFIDPLGSTLHGNFEEVFARLLISVLKLSMDRLAETLIARPAASSMRYLEELCHYYVDMLVHLCQSADYTKFSASFSRLLKSSHLTTTLTLDECVARSCPELAVKWFHMLSSAKAYESPSWKLVAEYGISPIVRRCANLFMCDRFKDLLLSTTNSSDHQRQHLLVELDAFLSNNMDIFEWVDEAPVKEFLSAALAQSDYARLVLAKLDRVLAEDARGKPSRTLKLLQCFDTAKLESIELVLDSITKFLSRCDQLSISKMAITMVSRKLDMLMVNRAEETKSILPLMSLRNFMTRLERLKNRRYAVLITRLDQLARTWYPEEPHQLSIDQCLDESIDDRESPIDSVSHPLAEKSLINPSPSSPTKFNRVKFLEFLQNVLRTEKRNTRMCAEALCSLSIDDVTEILGDERTTPRLLVACLQAEDRAGSASMWAQHRAQTPPGQQCKVTEIADVARRCLLQAIRTIVNGTSREYRAVFTARDYGILGEIDPNSADRLLSLSNGVYRLFKNARLKSTLTESELRLMVAYLCYLMTICLKRLDSIKLYEARRLIKVFIAAFRNEQFCRVLASIEHSESQAQLIGGAFWICSKALHIKDLQSFVEDLPISIDDTTLRTSWQYCNAYLKWIESKSIAQLNSCQLVAKRLFIGLCRLPCVTSFTHIPPTAFKYGWAPELRSNSSGYANLPTVPVHYLQNVDTLREFIFRVNTLGWSSRQQFEEIWMGLLGVLSATTIGRELLNNSPQETEERIVASSFAVRCLTALLLQTLLAPTPGNPLASTYVLKAREKQSTFMRTSFGQKLNDLRRNLRIRRRSSSNTSNSIVPPSTFGFNPERLHDSGSYAPGQLSIETLWSLTGILAEERDLVYGVPHQQQQVPSRSSPARSLQTQRVSEAFEATTPNMEVPTGSIVDESSKRASFVSYMPASSAGEKSAGTPGGGPEEFMAVRRSTSNFLLISESGLDLVSCLHFLLDLFTHWFGGGPDDVPLVLLSATVESVLYLSDLFTERSQYIWLRERLLAIFQNRSSDPDELLLQDTLLGLLKCSAVLGMNDTEKQKEATAFMALGLEHKYLSVRLATIHGVLYVLQSLTSDESISLMPLVANYVPAYISMALNGDLGRNLESPQSLEHQLAVWALGFYVVEAFHDPHTKTSFAPKFLELCCKAMQTDWLSIIILDCVINGLESLLVSTPVEARLVAQLTKLATERLQKPSSPQAAVLSMELLLTCLYTSKENRRFGDATTPDTEIAPRLAGEPNISAMERLTVLLNRVTEGSRYEATAIGSVLPDFLADHFSPSDVMNKVIIELLNPMQPHPQVLIRALHSLIEALLQQEVATVVCDWVLVSLPSFTCKNPAHFSIWALTCLLLSASTNSWVKALWPLAMSRYNASESQLDARLFCFAVGSFHYQLKEKSQIDALIKTIGKAAEKHPSSAYARAYDNFNRNWEQE